MAPLDENGSVCRHHSGHLARLGELQREMDELRDRQRELAREMGGMKKWILGLLGALLVGVYGQLGYQVSAENVSKQEAKKVAAHVFEMLEEAQQGRIHEYNGGP